MNVIILAGMPATGKSTLAAKLQKKFGYPILEKDFIKEGLFDTLGFSCYIYDAGYTIGNYWSAGCSTSSRETAAITLLEGKGGVIVEKKLRRGDQRTIGSGSNVVTVDILWPTASGISGDTSGGNDGSLTMKLTYGSSSYITAGDLFITAEQDILELYKDNPESLKADVMKTNHHGSYSSDCTEWVAAVDASKYALSERLVCGECGTLYRRCTWNIRGKKKIVWRCVSRLDHGTKYCKQSPTMEETVLQTAGASESIKLPDTPACL